MFFIGRVLTELCLFMNDPLTLLLSFSFLPAVLSFFLYFLIHFVLSTVSACSALASCATKPDVDNGWPETEVEEEDLAASGVT